MLLGNFCTRRKLSHPPKSGCGIKMVLWYLKHNFQNQDTAYKWYFDIWSSHNTSSKIRIQHKNGVLKFEAITIQFSYKNGILIFEATTIQYPKSHCVIKMVFCYLKQRQYDFQNQDAVWKWYFSIWNSYSTISKIGCSIKMVFFYLKQLFNSTILRRFLF